MLLGAADFRFISWYLEVSSGNIWINNRGLPESLWIIKFVIVLWYVYQLFSTSRATMSHLVAHAGYFSGLPEPHWSLPSKNFPPLFPAEPPHPSEVRTQQGLPWHEVLANCLPDPSDCAGSDFGKSDKDYVLPKRRYEIWPSWSMLPKQGCFARQYSVEKFSLLPTEEDQLSMRADRWGARTHLLPTRLLKNRSKRTIWFFFSPARDKNMSLLKEEIF